jgi:hypothetical protein
MRESGGDGGGGAFDRITVISHLFQTEEGERGDTEGEGKGRWTHEYGRRHPAQGREIEDTVRVTVPPIKFTASFE